MRKILPFLFIFLGLSFSTQKLAKLVQYDILIGTPLFSIGNEPIYNPFSFIIWYFQFYDVIPALFKKASIFLFASFFLTILFLLLTMPKKERDTHGSAYWLGLDKLKTVGFRDKEGVFLGHLRKGFYLFSPDIPLLKTLFTRAYIFFKGQNKIIYPLGETDYLLNNGNQHLMVVAPTRAGKGVGLIIPTLLGNWQGSALITDIKDENWKKTSGYRKNVMGHEVIRFAPTMNDGCQSRFNPINEVAWGTSNEYRDVQNLCHVLVGVPEKGEQSHWKDNAKALLTACLIHCKYKQIKDDPDGELTLKDLANFLKGTLNEETDDEGNVVLQSSSFKATLRKELPFTHLPVYNLPIFNEKTNLWEYHNLDEDFFQKTYSGDATLLEFPHKHPKVLMGFASFIGKADNEAASILSTALTPLEVYTEPIVAYNTSTSDFFIKDIMRSEKPVSLYLVTPPGELGRIMTLFRVFIELFVQKNTLAEGLNKHQCLLLLDEFAAFGKLEQVETGLGFIASYGLKVFMILQGLSQLSIYGNPKTNNILTGSNIQVYFAPNESETKDYVANALGKHTIEYETTSRKGFFDTATTTQNFKEKNLLTADEVGNLGEDIIIFQTGNAPLLVPKFRYFKDPEYIKRSEYKASKNSSIIKQKLDKKFPKQTIEKARKNTLLNDEENTEVNVDNNKIDAPENLLTEKISAEEKLNSGNPQNGALGEII